MPVTIEVLFFAQLREAVGSAKRSLEVAEGTTVDGLVAAIAAWPEWEPVSALPLSYAVNERLVDGGHRLRDGDTLALLTPISGG
jgi:molybdopterin converting factor small subunit